MLRRLFLLLLVTAVGCAHAEDSAADDDGLGVGGKADELEALPTCIDLRTACPADPPELGRPGEFFDEAAAIEWKHCGGDVSYAAPIYRQTTADLTSLAITVDDGHRRTGFALVNLGSRTLVSPARWRAPPFFHSPLMYPASTLALPVDPETVPAGPSCLAIIPIAAGRLTGQPGVVRLLSRRQPHDGAESIQLNLITVQGASISPAEVTEVGAEVGAIYRDAGAVRLDQVRVSTTDVVGPLIKLNGRDINTLRAWWVPDAPARSINVFFISDFVDYPGALGAAAGIPGPIGLHGSAGSGVVLAVDSHRADGGRLQIGMLAATIAHEIGHQLGLVHTTESTGDHDALDDTPVCPLSKDADGDGSLSAEECAGLDANHVMFWTDGEVGPQRTMSPTQARVFQDSVLAYPRGVTP